jgi:kynurenine formamidase
MYVPYDLSKVKVLDLSQNFSMDSPAFAFYEGPTVKWVKRLAFEGVNAQFISTTNHISTHLDSPIHFYDPGPDIAGIPLDTLVGPA